MASGTPLCGICDLQHVSNPAVVWCSDCDEGFCTDCSNHHRVSKLSRHHTTKPIEDYQKLPPNILEIEQSCKKHNETFILFCKNHDAPCCRICAVQNHKHCGDIARIEEIVKNVKTSNAFQEIEVTLIELARNITKIQVDREDNLELLQQSKMQVEKEINEFREKVNNHLDKIQAEIIKEMNKAEETEKTKIQKLVGDLKEHESSINEIQTNFSNIKQHASDLQAYFAMKQIQNDVDKTDAVVESLVNSDKLRQIHLSLEIHSSLKDILSYVKSFGNIAVETKGCKVLTAKVKNQQAQLLVPQQPRTIDDISLQLQQTLNVNSSCITSACMLPDGRFVFTDYIKGSLIFMNADGSQNITMNIKNIFVIIYVKYNNYLAVTSDCYPYHKIRFINIKNHKVEDIIQVQSFIYGIAEKDNILYFSNTGSINKLNLIDKTITKFKDINSSSFYPYIEVFENNLYHTNFYLNTVICYDLSGEVKWEFKDESIIKEPRRVTVDNQGNVYVAGHHTSNVVVISPDGKNYRDLFSTADKLLDPIAIYYDRSTDRLLVSNQQNTAFLFKVT